MHELGLAEGVLGVVTTIAGERSVRRVVVSAGKLTGVSGDSLEFGFQLLAEGTVAAGAALVVRTIDGDSLRVDEIEVEGEVIHRPELTITEAAHDESEHAEGGAHVHPAWL